MRNEAALAATGGREAVGCGAGEDARPADWARQAKYAGKRSGFQVSHCEKFAAAAAQVGGARCWGLVELVPPTKTAKPSAGDSLYPRIVRNARNDEKAQPPIRSERQESKSNHLNSS
jgi:hypothetical protein